MGAQKLIIQKEFTITMIFILAIVVVLMIVMTSSGLFDEKSSQFRSRAEFICWSNGYFAGVDTFAAAEEGFLFSCKNSSFESGFDKKINAGFLKGDLK
jgi:hypothetical protein